MYKTKHIVFNHSSSNNRSWSAERNNYFSLPKRGSEDWTEDDRSGNKGRFKEFKNNLRSWGSSQDWRSEEQSGGGGRNYYSKHSDYDSSNYNSEDDCLNDKNWNESGKSKNRSNKM